MRNLFKHPILSVALLLIAVAAFSQANTELSNLVAPTKVNVNLLPASDNSNIIGLASKSWKDIYIDGALPR